VANTINIMHDERYSTTRRLTTETPGCFDAPVDGITTLLKIPDSEQKIAEGGLRLQELYKTGSEDKPLITVVTVVYNGDEYLEDTIKSVIEQTYDNVEYIIVDGGSKDGTLDIIRKYEHVIDYWVSEPDNGIYYAMNKGIKLASGTIIGLINADDYYLENAVKYVVEQYERFAPDLVFGDKLMIKEDLGISKIISIDLPDNAKDVAIHIVHPTVFVAKATYKKMKFNEDYKIAADYDFMIRAYNKKLKILKVEKIISVMRAGGVSDNFNIEACRIKLKYFGRREAFVCLITRIYSKVLRIILFAFVRKPNVVRWLYIRKGWVVDRKY